MATITGTAGSDNLSGTSAADLILGNMGNDNIVGNGGQDSLYGGVGNDAITYGPLTGPGAPTLDTSSTLIFGGLGSDTITAFNGPRGFSTIYGGANTSGDSVDGSNTFNLANDGGVDFVFAGGGGDSITLGFGAGSSVTGGIGNDTINAGNGSNVKVNADQGNDSILGSLGGGDLLHGGLGNDSVSLTNTFMGGQVTRAGSIVAADLGADVINDLGGSANDTLYGGKGNDSITIGTGGGFVASGNDVVFAGLDSDLINVSGSGRNSIYGGTDTTGQAADSGNVINASSTAFAALVGNGATGRDLLVGGGGADSIIASDATIPGGGGAAATVNQATDTLTGGAGNDTFSFLTATTGAEGYGFTGAGAKASDIDSVTDFLSGSDKFHLGTAAGFVPNNVDVLTTAAQTAVQNATTLNGAAKAAAVGLAANGDAAVFTFQGSNYLFADASANKTFDTGDYLINVGNVTTLSKADFIA